MDLDQQINLINLLIQRQKSEHALQLADKLHSTTHIESSEKQINASLARIAALEACGHSIRAHALTITLHAEHSTNPAVCARLATQLLARGSPQSAHDVLLSYAAVVTEREQRANGKGTCSAESSMQPRAKGAATEAHGSAQKEEPCDDMVNSTKNTSYVDETRQNSSTDDDDDDTSDQCDNDQQATSSYHTHIEPTQTKSQGLSTGLNNGLTKDSSTCLIELERGEAEQNGPGTQHVPGPCTVELLPKAENGKSMSQGSGGGDLGGENGGRQNAGRAGKGEGGKGVCTRDSAHGDDVDSTPLDMDGSDMGTQHAQHRTNSSDMGAQHAKHVQATFEEQTRPQTTTPPSAMPALYTSSQPHVAYHPHNHPHHNTDIETLLPAIKAHPPLAPPFTDACVQLGDYATSSSTSSSIVHSTTYTAHSLYSLALSVTPHHPKASLGLSAVLTSQNRVQEALNCLQAATSAHPGDAMLLTALGKLQHSLGLMEDAQTTLTAALQSSQTDVSISNALSNVLLDIGNAARTQHAQQACQAPDAQPQHAISCYERALLVNPHCWQALANLAGIAADHGNPERAIGLYHAALSINTHVPEVYINVGILYRQMYSLDRAAQCFERAASISGQPHLRSEQGVIGGLGSQGLSVASGLQGVVPGVSAPENPTTPTTHFPIALNNLALVSMCKGHAQEAHDMLKACIACCPTYAEAHNNLGVLLRDIGDPAGGVTCYKACEALLPSQKSAGSNRLMALNYFHHGEERIICDAHTDWGLSVEADVVPLPPPPLPSATPTTLRIGYISPDLRLHSVSYFAEVALRGGRGVEVYVYSCVGVEDAKTARLKCVVEGRKGVWRNVRHLTDMQLAQQVRADGVHVLVELTGHTAENRLSVMPYRAAPVQVTWIGYPNSTGLKSVDYRITDSVCDPLSTTQTFSESLIRLPHCFLCYTPDPNPPAPSPPPCCPMDMSHLAALTRWRRLRQRLRSCGVTFYIKCPGHDWC